MKLLRAAVLYKVILWNISNPVNIYLFKVNIETVEKGVKHVQS